MKINETSGKFSISEKISSRLYAWNHWKKKFGGREKAKFIIHVYTSRVYTQHGGTKK